MTFDDWVFFIVAVALGLTGLVAFGVAFGVLMSGNWFAALILGGGGALFCYLGELVVKTIRPDDETPGPGSTPEG